MQPRGLFAKKRDLGHAPSKEKQLETSRHNQIVLPRRAAACHRAAAFRPRPFPRLCAAGAAASRRLDCQPSIPSTSRTPPPWPAKSRSLSTSSTRHRAQGSTPSSSRCARRATPTTTPLVFPWAKSLTGTAGKNPGWDPLAYLIEQADLRGMEVHAWINPYRLTEGSVANPDTDVSALPLGHPARAKPLARRGL